MAHLCAYDCPPLLDGIAARHITYIKRSTATIFKHDIGNMAEAVGGGGCVRGESSGESELLRYQMEEVGGRRTLSGLR